MLKLSDIKEWRECINQTVQGDCIEAMKMIPDKSIDLILTDPPYNAKNIGPNHRVYIGQRMQLSTEEYKTFCEDWFREAFRISKNLLFTPGISNICFYPQPTWIIAWHKPCAVSFNRMGGFNAWEPIFFYGKMPKGKRLGQDYILCNTRNLGNPIERGHPCPKPLELMRILVDKFSIEGELVMDPFMGSGTTARACKDLSRNYIGTEMIEEYCKIIDKRLEQEIMF